jgi:CheY-like chemotaxis protein
MSAPGLILVAEDDDNDAFLLEHAFQEAQIPNPLCRARDGQEAIDYLVDAGRIPSSGSRLRPSLLLLDVKMPRKTGWDVLHWLRNESSLRYLPVIVFSSSAQQEDIDRAYQMGANSFIVKPSSTQKRTELAKCIEALWLQFNERPSACLNA